MTEFKEGREVQLLGRICTSSEELSAMLCRDLDKPQEAMLHWWGKTDNGAALVHIAKDGLRLGISPQVFYQRRQDGGLTAPRLNEEEHKRIFAYRAELQITPNGLEGTWTAPSVEGGEIELRRTGPGDLVHAHLCSNWSEFKKWATASKEIDDAVWFRGHGKSNYRLMTTLHRAGRGRLERYCAETLPRFRSHAEAVLGTEFSLSNGDHYSTLLGLAQHHGLPTPLLDWTESPYIAAFFAFSAALEGGYHQQGGLVRVYGLTRDFVANSNLPTVILPFISPYIASLSISARQNPRLYAQQGTFLVTNVAEVEVFICGMQKRAQKTFLVAADVPAECVVEALEDLKFMGLSAATMFPGLDGVARMMRHEMAFKREAVPASGKPTATT